ncbi:hypothetical protein O1M63_44105 [Streptomyces mirabilis]|nr:hypothetical protein [Streptomyces mirabilis]
MTARETGRRRAWAVVIGVSVVLALVSYLAVRFLRPATPDECTAHGPHDTTVTLDPDQASHAATIAAVAHARGLPERAVTIALATAIQESKLRNLTYGDRDSLGLFQQRPSQGWGSPAQISDPVYTSGRFFDALVKVPDYRGLPVTVAAQQVQHSGYPQAYAQHEDVAATLADVLTGREGPALSCTVSGANQLPPTRGAVRRARRARPVAVSRQPSGGSSAARRPPCPRPAATASATRSRPISLPRAGPSPCGWSATPPSCTPHP